MPEPPPRSVRRTAVIATATARRAARSAVVWGVLFGLLIANEMLTYRSMFPTTASRREFAASFGSNAALSAVIGPGRQLDTIEGVVAWRVFGLVIIVGAVWGLLTATRLLRGEEDAGRWELLLAGRTSRRHATAQALSGLAVGWVVLTALTTGFAVVAGLRDSVGLPASASAFYALTATSSAALFLAVGAVASQLVGTRRQASGLALAVFGAFYLLRLLADAGLGIEWLRWTSPLGWIENARPLTDPRPLALLPVAVLVLALSLAAVAIAHRRDAGVGVLGRERAAASADVGAARPRSATGLAWRLERWVVVGWVAGLGVLALVFGITAAVAGQADFGSTVGESVGRLGGSGAGVEAWIGYEFLYLAAILAFAAAAQVAALRDEEAEGRLDHLLARPLGRSRWLAGRLLVGTVVVAGSGLAMAVGGWVGLAGEGIGLSAMLQAGLNAAVPGIFVLGVGTLLYGVLPRLAAPALYVLVLWSFLVETIGSSITDNRWLLDTALLTHLGPVPAADLDWSAVAVLTGVAVLAALVGLFAFDRRDLVTA